MRVDARKTLAQRSDKAITAGAAAKYKRAISQINHLAAGGALMLGRQRHPQRQLRLEPYEHLRSRRRMRFDPMAVVIRDDQGGSILIV